MQLWNEIDTEHRYLLLQSQLEDCISFISSVGGGDRVLSGDTKLSSFILDLMLIDPAKWMEMSTATLVNAVYLRHIKSVVEGLKDRQRGSDGLEEVDAKYRQPLTASQVEALRRCVTGATTATTFSSSSSSSSSSVAAGSAVAVAPVDSNASTLLLRAVKDLLKKLMDTSFGFSDVMCENLPYLGGGDLADCEWFDELFPKDLRLKHAFATYTFLKVIVLVLTDSHFHF